MNPDIDIRINVILFSTSAAWMYDGMVNIASFRWQQTEAEGLTSLGIALNMLNESLSNDNLFSHRN